MSLEDSIDPPIGPPVRSRDRRKRDERQKMVTDLRSLAFTPTQIVRQVAHKFGCSEKTVWSDLKFVDDEARWNARRDNGRQRLLEIQKLEALYRRAFADNDWKACANIRATLAKIHGVFAPTQIEASGKVGVEVSGVVSLAGMKSGDKRVRLAELLGKAAAVHAAKLAAGARPTNGANGSNGNGHQR